jgi:hypothetical protein
VAAAAAGEGLTHHSATTQTCVVAEAKGLAWRHLRIGGTLRREEEARTAQLEIKGRGPVGRPEEYSAGDSRSAASVSAAVCSTSPAAPAPRRPIPCDEGIQDMQNYTPPTAGIVVAHTTTSCSRFSPTASCLHCLATPAFPVSRR